MGFLDWLHRRHREPDGQGDCPKLLIEDAEKRRQEAYARWPAVLDAAAQVDAQGRRNHFGETVDELYRRRRYA